MFNKSYLLILIIFKVSLFSVVCFGQLQYLKTSNYLSAGCIGNPVSYSWLQLNSCRGNVYHLLTNSSNLQNGNTTDNGGGLPTAILTASLSNSFTNPVTAIGSGATSLQASSATGGPLPIVPVVIEMYCVDPTCSQPTSCLPGNTIAITGQCVPSSNGFFMIYSITNSVQFTRDNNQGNCYSQSYLSVCNIPPYYATQDGNNLHNIGYFVNCTENTYNYYVCRDVECSIANLKYNMVNNRCISNSNSSTLPNFVKYSSFIPTANTPVPSDSTSSLTTNPTASAKPISTSDASTRGGSGGSTRSSSSSTSDETLLTLTTSIENSNSNTASNVLEMNESVVLKTIYYYALFLLSIYTLFCLYN